jgi:hypothetical protein
MDEVIATPRNAARAQRKDDAMKTAAGSSKNQLKQLHKYIRYFIQLIISQTGFWQLCQGFGQLFIIGCNAMPFVATFHKVNAFAHGGIH